jgi:hypothetical protein
MKEINEFIKYILLFIKEIFIGVILFFVIGIVLVIIMTFIDNYYKKSNNIIEDNIELQKHNDSLKIEVDNLDSIKNAKVIEVKTLDNDSTIKLFYQLIK